MCRIARARVSLRVREVARAHFCATREENASREFRTSILYIGLSNGTTITNPESSIFARELNGRLLFVADEVPAKYPPPLDDLPNQPFSVVIYV